MWMNQNLIAIWRQAQNDSDDLFEELSVPSYNWLPSDDYIAADWQFSKEYLEKLILMRYGGLCSLIGDPAQLEEAIGIWSDTHYPIWQQLYKSIFYNYNPVHNIDYTESNTENSSEASNKNNTRSTSGTNREQDNNTSQHTESSATSENNTETNSSSGTDTSSKNANDSSASIGSSSQVNRQAVAPFNDSGLTENQRNVIDGNTTNNINNNSAENTTQQRSGSDNKTGNTTSNSTDNGSSSDNRDIQKTYNDTVNDIGSESKIGNSSGSRRVKGTNISGSLVDALVTWREYKNLNLYEIIAAEFAKEFLIMIW